MKATGIIAEYNPLHKGHAYHIAKSREITGADCVIAILGGNFVQRGEPAVIDKYTRTQAALINGIDLVIELPVVSAVGSAQYFARGSIGILTELGADYLCFGSEAGDIAPFHAVLDLLATRQDEIDRLIHMQIRKGLSYPLARSKAIEQFTNAAGLSVFFNMPNNILGLEYCQEIIKQNSAITPLTIKRTQNNYHENELSGQFSSADAIRTAIRTGEDAFWDSLPQNVHPLYQDYFTDYAPVFIDDFTDIIRFKLAEIRLEKHSYFHDTRSIAADLPEFLLNKLLAHIQETDSVTQLIEAVKTKDLTYTRISRALIHLMLGITEKDYDNLKEKPCSYIRVLGFNETGRRYLSSIKKNLSCPLIIKPASFKEYLTKDIYASDIYNQILSRKSGHKTTSDYQRQIKPAKLPNS